MRSYSKSRAVGGHITSTYQQVFPAAFQADGLATDGMRLGEFRVPGAPYYCPGFVVRFDSPPAAGDIVLHFDLYQAGTKKSGTRLTLRGTKVGGQKILSPDVAMPKNTLWWIEVTHERGDDRYLPQGLSVTYLLRFARGPAVNRADNIQELPAGIGFWQIEENFTIQ